MTDKQTQKRIKKALSAARAQLEKGGAEVEEYQVKTLACTALRLTDIGNAERLALRFGDRLRFVQEAKTWAVYEQGRWNMGGEKSAQKMAQEVVRNIYFEAGFASDQKKAADILQHADRSAKASNTRGMLEQAQAILTASIFEFDTDDTAHLFNCKNGTVNLRTGELQKHNPDDMLTAMCPVRYDAKAKAPRWIQFIQEVSVDADLQRDPDKEAFLHRALGYSLIGTNEEQVSFFVTGRSNDRKKNGENGKGVLQNTMRAISGDYFANIDRRTICRDSRGEVDSKHNAPLIGKRIAFGSELLKTDVIHPQNYKNLTGEDVVKAKLLYRDEIDLENKAALWYLTNYMALVPDDDDGIYRRIVIIPFMNKFYAPGVCPPGGFVRDNGLKSKLREEMPGILAWLVRGAMEYFERGTIDVPEKLRAIKEQSRSDLDQLHEWEQRCIEFDDDAVTPAMDLIVSVRNFNRLNGEGELSDTIIGRKLNDRGIEKISKDPNTGKTYRQTMRRGARLNAAGKAYLAGKLPAALSVVPDTMAWKLNGTEQGRCAVSDLPDDVLAIISAEYNGDLPPRGVRLMTNAGTFERIA